MATSIHKLKNNQSPARINNVEHVDLPGAKATMDVLAPGTVITSDISAAWVKVGLSSIVRIQVAADTYVAFGDDSTAGVVDSSTSPAIKLAAGYYLLRATGEFIRASLNASRIEILPS